MQITDTLSRRRFLQVGGVAGAGLLLGGCTSSGPRSIPPSALPTGDAATEPRIAIVGAGLAGLAAAYWLTRAGDRVRVYEARPRIGGRCWSARGFDGGQVAEHGGEFVDTRHVHIARLAEELGLELDDLWSTWISGSRWPTYVDGQIVRSGDLFEPLDEAAKEIVRIAERNGPWWAAEANADARTLDEMSMADWFDANVPGEGSVRPSDEPSPSSKRVGTGSIQTTSRRRTSSTSTRWTIRETTSATRCMAGTIRSQS